MSTLPITEKIGEAWRLHRDGNNDGAVRMFQDLISTHPENVDAYYGLGLAYKANGDRAKATASFKQALEITEQALSAVQKASQAEGHASGNDLETNIDDRYMMLTRMLKQRLEDLS